MKLLLDENLPHQLRSLIVGHDVYTAAYMRYSGLTNGVLLQRAADDGFDAMLTLMLACRINRIRELCRARSF